ncbi:MAG: ExeA family protein [Rubripirellula sp.]
MSSIDDLNTMQPSDPNYIVPPFPPFPSSQRYVAVGSVKDATERVSRAVNACEAVSLIIGPPGTGKSLICSLLSDQFQGTHDVVVLGETPIQDSATFLRHLLHHLGADFAGIPDNDLQLALINRVCSASGTEGGLLLIVDEAQSLPMEVIEAIRMVTNITRGGQPRVFAVLCGGVKLDETLVATSMEAFTQRAATRCYLHAMNGEETRQYVCDTISQCDADPEETITLEAIAAVHHACSGVPRLINQLLTQAIDCAADADQSLIDEQMIDRAWAELQQLPSPMVEEPKIALTASNVEFGELSDSESTMWDEPAAVDVPDDIEVEPTGAMWVDESTEAAEPIMPAAEDMETCEPSISGTTTSALFGEFDEEEELVIGDAFVPPKAAAPVVNLESILQQEIVGMSSMVADACQIVPESTEDSSIDMAMESRLLALAEGTEASLQFEAEVEPEAAMQPEADLEPELEMEAVSYELELDQPEILPLSDADCIPLSRDDQDMLVIEDELDLQPVDTVARVDGERHTISVDFHQMLNKMRAGV